MKNRVNLTLPNGPAVFRSHYTVGMQEINMAQHMGNDKYLVLAEEVFQRFNQSMGFKAGTCFGEASFVAGIQVAFLNEARYGDEIEMKLWLPEHSTKSFRVFVQLIKEQTEIAQIQVDRVFVDMQTHQTIPCPAALIEFIAQ